ncbi:hypothetical protein VP01_511g1 [Puccinia sorghi]|uniref:ER membrane protein complex subunit 1 n=1 Tax=Puccinia sorghi TaxID=27349 RepID=A0A0L6UL56_9BASI|nr:hypothetical protein VP01_511g1 [Puccinia sorghi]
MNGLQKYCVTRARMVNSESPLSFLAILTLLLPLVCSFHSSEVTWHLPLLGLPVSPSARHPSSLQFFRHPNPKVRLTPRLPSLAITVTQKNILGAINPKDGTIGPFFSSLAHNIFKNYGASFFPKPNRSYIMLLIWTIDVISLSCFHFSHVALLSGEKKITARLFSLSDGRLLWSKSLGDSSPNQIDQFIGRTYEVVFTTDLHSDHRNFPDLIVLTGQSWAFRLAGNDGAIRWAWRPVDLSWKILRVLKQTSADQINLLLSKDDSESTYITQVQSLSSATGSAYDHRAEPLQTCSKSGDPLLILTGTDSKAPSPMVICVDHESNISSALVPNGPTAPLQLSTFSTLKHRHPVLQDVGLSSEGVFLVKLSDGSAVVFTVTPESTLKSLWSFDPSDLSTTYSGSIDRDGLPYVSKVSFVPTLGLASLEILSLTPTERTPEGMVIGSTFGYDHMQNGDIIGISVEVLQVINYKPMSRVILVTGLGDIQLWQGEELKWERHEDISLPASITLHQSKSLPSPLLNTDPFEIPRQVLRLANGLFSGQISIQSFNANLFKQAANNAYIWLIGSATGRLFAIVRDQGNQAKILWRRSLMLPGIVGSRTTLKWKDLSFEGTKAASHPPSVVVSIEIDESQTSFWIGLMDGKILKQVTATVCPSPSYINSHQFPRARLLDMGGSPARFLGDRGALFKYLNPNLAVYFNNDLDRQTIEVHDQASGSLVWAFEFAVKVDPASIKAAITENWLVIVSREAESGSTRIHSTEWFMSSKADVRVDGSTANITSYARSYITPFDIKDVGFTKSRLGVTSRALLGSIRLFYVQGGQLISDMDQIVSISRRLLDVRRPFKKPTTEETEEFLIMYDPLIMVDPKTIITGDRPTKGFEHVYSFPTEFESTSAVIGVGLDVFATSTAPSGSFDMLGSDFNKAQLVLTSAGLLLTTFILRPIVHKKQLKRQWYT